MASTLKEDMAASTEVIIERIEALRCDVQDISKKLEDHNRREGEFREHYVKEHGLVDNKAQRAHERIDQVEARIMEHAKQMDALRQAMDSLQKSVQPLIFANKVMMWLAGILGSTIIILIWSLITGQAQVVFP